jgi:Ulp1 protease family, C-terminal catalytic domain
MSKRGKRYFMYKNKRYRIKSKASNKDIYHSLIKIINKLLKKGKRKPANKKEKGSRVVKTKEPLYSSYRIPEEKPLTEEQLERYKKFSKIQQQEVIENKTKLLEAAKDAQHEEIEKLKLLKENSAQPSANPSTAGKKLVERIKYSEGKIDELQKQEKLLLDNIESLESRGHAILKELKDKQLEDFIKHVNHKVVVRAHKDVFGADSNTGVKSDGSKGKKSKKEILEEIDEKLPGLWDYIHNHIDEDPDDVIVEFINSQSGQGLKNGEGLYNYEVTDLMRKYGSKGFLGTFSIDEMGEIDPKKFTQVCFILNVMPSNIKWGHFVAVMIDKDRKTLEYYDPLGNDPPNRFLKQIKRVLNDMGMNGEKIQLKINRVRFQSFKSSNCGYFSMMFLIRRFKGQPFKVASGYTHFKNILKSEHDITNFKKNIQKFGYIK